MCVCEKKIIAVKYRTFPGARKIVDFYMKGHSYANVSQKTNPIRNNNNNKTEKYRAFIVQLGPNDQPKFQELLKRTCTAKSCQTEIVNKLEESISNPNTTDQMPRVQNSKAPPEANRSRQKLQRLLICLANLKIDFPWKVTEKTGPTNIKNTFDTHKNTFQVLEIMDDTLPKSSKQNQNY